MNTYSKVAAAKLYTTRNPITSADLLNDKVLPLFEEHGIGVIRILTDRVVRNIVVKPNNRITSHTWQSIIRKMCCGGTPTQTFLDVKQIWTDKVDSLNLIVQ